MRRWKSCFLGFFLGFMSFTATAGEINNYFYQLKRDIRDTWNMGRGSVYVPAYAWHNRLTYDKEHIKRYNENPWGLGLGQTFVRGHDKHGLYVMAFKDSNKYLETFFGYLYLRNYFFDIDQNWRFGYGYTLGMTQRHEYHYIPVPLPLPAIGLGYRGFSVNAAYVPGVKNDGNVLFAWVEFDF